MPRSAEIEENRVAALRGLMILDTPRQACFQRITEFCTRQFGCAYAFVSLVDADRQWFLARTGIDLCETPTDISFSSHVVHSGHSLLVSDAWGDDRFARSPLVTDGPRIRSYLGEPIRGNGGALLGTLCVADSRPDRFDSGNLEQLRFLARIVEDLVDAHSQRTDASELASRLRERSDRLEKSNRIFAQAEKIAKMGSWELDLQANALKYSAESYAILGLAPDRPVTLEDSLNLYVAEDRPMIEKAIERILANHQASHFEAHIITPGGEKKRLRVVGEYLEANDDHPARLFGVLQDVTEAYQHQLELQRAANYDALTNVFNRQAFDRYLIQRLKPARPLSDEFFLLLFDLDGFKDINDSYGHLVGDAILEAVSNRIVGIVPNDVPVARWGGDEFAVITLPGISAREATNLAEAVILAISEQVEIGGRKVSVSATCGIARSEHGIAARELLRRADLALYYGKSREPGRIHHYEAKLEHEMKLRQEAITVVREALNEGRIYPGYQPIVNLETNAIVGFEALMRLVTRTGKQINAGQVMPAILDPIISRDISERMIQLVSSEFSEVCAARPDVHFISLNATQADLFSREFSDRLLDALRAKKIPPHKVTLEITETMLLVNDAASVQTVLSKLSLSGVQIALDDFGTGFSSLTHLRDFPIDKVKIDGSFIRNMASDHQSRLIVQALIAMARNLGKEVIAEGVETPEQRDLLRHLGCRYGQGYLYGCAESADRLHVARRAKAK